MRIDGGKHLVRNVDGVLCQRVALDAFSQIRNIDVASATRLISHRRDYTFEAVGSGILSAVFV